MTIRWNVATVGLLCLAVVAALSAGEAFGQRRALPKAAEARALQDDRGGGRKLAEVYYGASACSNKGCHGGDPPKNWIRDPDTGKQLELRVRCDEAEIYLKSDKHADAYKVLAAKGGLGERMGKILGYDVTKAPQCLSCHSVVIKDKDVLQASRAVGFDVAEGVSCVVCHGAHTEWVAQHGLLVTAGRFRFLPREVKERDYGMTDLHDPVKRALLCSSCHVGNLSEGKFVTHEMYAAGHPPLPSFELSTFCDQLPPHWRLWAEKSPALQKELKFRPGEKEESHQVLVGGVVAFGQTMALLRDQAREAMGNTDQAKQALDLSNFDCWSCHHDLKKQSWRQTAAWVAAQGGKPGRPTMRDWSAELMRLAVAHLAEKDPGMKETAQKLESGLRDLRQAFLVPLGGDTKRIYELSESLARLSHDLAPRVSAAYPREADLRRLSAEVVPQLFSRGLLGYDSARQVAWAQNVLLNELSGKEREPATIDAALKPFEALLRLRLPSGRGAAVEGGLNESMKAVDGYDPFEFQKRLRDLGGARKAPKQ